MKVETQRVQTVEKPDSWEVSYSPYSPKEEAVFGGPLIIAVDKNSGKARLVAAYQ